MKRKSFEDYFHFAIEEIPGLVGGGTIIHASFVMKAQMAINQDVLVRKHQNYKHECIDILKKELENRLRQLLGEFEIKHRYEF